MSVDRSRPPDPPPPPPPPPPDYQTLEPVAADAWEPKPPLADEELQSSSSDSAHAADQVPAAANQQVQDAQPNGDPLPEAGDAKTADYQPTLEEQGEALAGRGAAGGHGVGEASPGVPALDGGPSEEGLDAKNADVQRAFAEQAPLSREQGDHEGAARVDESAGRLAEMVGLEPVRGPADTAKLGADGVDSSHESLETAAAATGAEYVTHSVELGERTANELAAQSTTEGDEALHSTVVPNMDVNPELSRTIEELKTLKQPALWRAGETHVLEMNDAESGRTLAVVRPNGETQGRRPDAVKSYADMGITAIAEVKTYDSKLPGAEERGVPLDPRLQTQIDKDVALRHQSEQEVAARESDDRYIPTWIFVGLGPSQELDGALSRANIIWTLVDVRP